MTVITLMAKALQQELKDRCMPPLSPADCEAIMRAVIARSGKIAAALLKSERGEWQ